MHQLLSMRSSSRGSSQPHLVGPLGQPAVARGQVPAACHSVCKRSIMSRAVTFILNLIYIFLVVFFFAALCCYLAFVFGQAATAATITTTTCSSSNSMAIVACRLRCCCCCCAAAGDLQLARDLQFFCLLLELPFDRVTA